MKKKNELGVVGRRIPVSQQTPSNRATSPPKRPPPSKVPGTKYSSNLNQQQQQPKFPPKTTLASNVNSSSSQQNPQTNQSETQQKADVSANPSQKQIPSISQEYENMRKRLEELKEIIRQLTEKWQKIISDKESEHISILDQLTKQFEAKLAQLEHSHVCQSKSGAMNAQIEQMKAKADALKKEGKENEAEQLLRQARDIGSQFSASESYSNRREIEARKQPLIKAHQLKVENMKVTQKAEIEKLKKERDAEIGPFKEEYEKLDKRIHGDAAKVARSTLCKK